MIDSSEKEFDRHFLQSRVAKRRHFAVMLLSLGLAACAGMGGITPETPVEKKEAVVAERAQERWNALIRNDYLAAYEYLSPTARELLPYDEYRTRARGELRYTAAKVDRVTCEAEACKVRMIVTYDHRLMKGIVTPVDESWVLDKGQFWYLYR